MINDMRTLLRDSYNICDFQPYVGIKGRHAGDNNEIDNRSNRFRNTTRDEDEDDENHTGQNGN